MEAWSRWQNIPAEMVERPNWLVWSIGEGGKKLPRQISGKSARVDAPETLSDFETAATYARYYDGIGFVLARTGIVCIDLDNCLNLINGRASGKAEQIVKSMASYTETSQSGRGLHIFGLASAALIERIGNGRRKAGLEVYANNRYIATTGNVYGGYSELQDINKPLASLIKSEFRAETKHRNQEEAGAQYKTPEPLTKADRQLIERARSNWKTGSQFSALFDRGSLSMDGNDNSRADWHLLNIIAYWTHGDEQAMLRIFSASKLAERPKWRTRPDYRANIIQAVLRKRSGN